MPNLRHLAALPIAALLFALPARAADVTQDDATALEAQLHDWLSGLVAPALDVGARPIRVSPAGDHFQIEIPEPDLMAATGLIEPGLSVTLKARLMDGGRWALDDLRFPSPLRIHAPKDATAAPGAPEQVWVGSIDKQDYHGVFDPSFATTSSFDQTWHGYRTVASGQTTFIATSSGHTVLQPAGDGRVNLIIESTGEKLDAQISTPDIPPVSYKADKVRSSGHIDGLLPSGLASLIRTVAALAPGMKDVDKTDKPTDEQRRLAHEGFDSLSRLLSAAEASWSMEGVQVNAMGQAATLRRAAVGSSFGTPEGKLSLGIDIEMEGFDSPAVPKGVLRDYLPRKIVLKPRIGGFPAEDATHLLQRAIDTDPQDMPALQADALAVLAANPVEIAIDDLVIDCGRATITATGSVEAASPDDITGEAEITMTGLDALMKRANTAPELKEIAPVLLILKGLGKQDGENTTWSINYEGGKITVNDTDVSEMMGKK